MKEGLLKFVFFIVLVVLAIIIFKMLAPDAFSVMLIRINNFFITHLGFSVF